MDEPQFNPSELVPAEQVGPDGFETKLDPQKEAEFTAWKSKVAPNDSGNDYDLRGAFNAGVTPDPSTGHWPDTFKKPNHPTFSDQSVYAKIRPDLAGKWEGEKYIPHDQMQPNPEDLIPAEANFAKAATEHLEQHRQDPIKYPLTPAEIFHLNKVAQAGQGWLKRAAVKGAGVLEHLGEAATGLKDTVSKMWDHQMQVGQERFKKLVDPNASLSDRAKTVLASMGQDWASLQAGAARGTTNLAPLAVDLAGAAIQSTPAYLAAGLVSPEFEQNLDAAVNTAGDVVHAGISDAANKLDAITGADREGIPYAIGENVAPLAVGAPGLEGAAGAIEKGAQQLPKMAAKARGAVATGISKAAPAIATVAKAAPGAAAGALVGGAFAHTMIPELVGGWLTAATGGSVKAAIISMIRAKMDEIAKAAAIVSQAPEGVSAVEALSKAAAKEAQAAAEEAAYLRAGLKPEEIAKLDAVNPVTNEPMFHVEHKALSSGAKQVREAEARAQDLANKAEVMANRTRFNRFAEDLDRYGLSVGAHALTGAGIGAVLGGAGSPPGDEQAAASGAILGGALGTAGAAIRAPGAIRESVRGANRFDLVRRAVQLSPDHPLYEQNKAALDSLGDPARNYLLNIAGLAKPEGKPLVVLNGDDMIAAINAEGGNVQIAPAGFEGKDHVYARADALEQGVAPHELIGHGAKIDSDPAVVAEAENIRNSTDPNIKAKWDAAVAKYEARMQRVQPGFVLGENSGAELAAALTADVMRDLPPDALYGGRSIGQKLSKWFAQRFGTDQAVTTTSQFGFPVTPEMRGALEDALFELGKKAQESKPEPVVKPTGKRAGASPPAPAPATVSPHADTAAEALVALGYSKKDAAEMAAAAEADLHGRSEPATAESIVTLASQKKANPVPLAPGEAAPTLDMLKPGKMMPDERIPKFMPSDHPDAIKEAAVKDMDSGRIVTGSSHWHADQKLGEAGTLIDGFVTNSGEFLTRKEAYKRAQEHRQMRDEKAPDYKRKYGIGTEDLKFMPDVEFKHWSKRDDLSELDPKFHGTGIKGAEGARRRDYPELYVPRTYVGLEGYQKEGALPNNEYRGKVNTDRIYDFNDDPNGFMDKAWEKVKASPKYANFDERAAITTAEGLIKKAGFDGYKVEDVVALFKKVPVKPAEVPAGAFMPDSGAAAMAEDYVKKSGIGEILPPSNAKVDVERARRIAAEYEKLPAVDNSPETKAAYKAFGDEVEAQYQHATDSGMKFEFTQDDPYKTSAEMMKDVADGHLKVFTGGSDHPFLGSETRDANGLTLNDKFRAVHDLYGHASEGNQFGPHGEERAWRKHAAMFSDAARPAMTAETRGQNSWVNYGPHMFDENGWKGDKSHPDYIPPSDRPYADQKSALLPNEFSNVAEPAPNETSLANISRPTAVRDETIRNSKNIIDVSEDAQQLPKGWTLQQDGGLWVARDDNGKLVSATGSRQGTLDNARESLKSALPKFMPSLEKVVKNGPEAYMEDVDESITSPARYFRKRTSELSKIFQSGKATLHRAVSTDEAPNLKELGSSWVADKKDAFVHYGIDNGEAHHIISAEVPASSVDWESTLIKNMSRPWEKEIVIQGRVKAARSATKFMPDAGEPTSSNDILTGPAIKTKDDMIIRGFTHNDAVKEADKYGLDLTDAIVGYTTKNGHFLDQHKALSWGQEIGQLPEDLTTLNTYDFHGARKFMPDEDQSWMDRSGNTVPVPTGSNHGRELRTATGSNFFSEAWDKGFVRVTRIGDELIAHNERGQQITPSQRKNLIRIAEDRGLNKITFDGSGDSRRIIWESDQKFMPDTGKAPDALAKEAERLSLSYKGAMGDNSELHLFNDPITKSTISVKADAPAGTLQQKLDATRQKFLNPDGLKFMPDERPEAIKAAALKYPDGQVFTGVIHLDALNNAMEHYAKEFPRDWANISESFKDGYVDGNDNFLTRAEAMVRAKQLKQVTDKSYAEANKRLGAGTEMGLDNKNLEAMAFQRSRKFMPEVSDLGFYSKLEQVIEDKLPNKASSDQIRATIAKGGVKAEELKWTGLDDFLKENPNPTKAELLKHVQENNVQVHEVMLGEPSHDVEPWWNDEGGANESTPWNELSAQERSMAKIRYQDEVGDYEENATQHAAHVLPGAQEGSYRELVFTREPPTVPKDIGYELRAIDPEQQRNLIAAGITHQIVTPTGGSVYSGSKAQAEAHLKTLQATRVRNPDYKGYTSSHFENVPNYLAHARFNDRAGPNSEKILHLEEVQSDLHQEGRRKGYASNSDELPSGYSIRRVTDEHWVLEKDGKVESNWFPGKPSKGYPELTDIDAQKFFLKDLQSSRAPDAPFKTTWPALVMKRMLRYAAEHGYDALSWTTGEQQAARYDLSKHVDSVQAYRIKDSEDIGLAVYHKDGDAQTINAPMEKLSEYIGKDLADKIIKDLEGEVETPRYSGLDLKVGGEGMKGFYDKILPSVANDIGKKFGAKHYKRNIFLEDRSQYLNPHLGDEIATVHSIPITDAMRESVTKVGQPLFMPDITDRWHEARQGLTEQELSNLRDKDVARITDIFNSLPSTEEGADIALKGKAKKSWYRDAAQSISDTFGPDGDRFGALLAALSPQTSVESNLRNALHVWNGWQKAGRPTNPIEIEQLIEANVEQGKGEKSALGAWMKNSVKSLTASDPSPDGLKLSGPKVNSFFNNLRDAMNEITNDRWMGYYGGDRSMFQETSRLNRKEGQPIGKGPGYIAMNSHIRQVAKHLTELTGEVWTPAEVQATIWSYTKTLKELADKHGLTPQELLTKRKLTDEDIQKTPDFATLLQSPKHEGVLSDIRRPTQAGNAALRSGAGGFEGQAGSLVPATGPGDLSDLQPF